MVTDVAGQEAELGPGDSDAIPKNVPHSLIVLSAGEVVDVFAPAREDHR